MHNTFFSLFCAVLMGFCTQCFIIKFTIG
ncbi:hypothetical protein ACFW04_001025 [Cataglyphis niger]